MSGVQRPRWGFRTRLLAVVSAVLVLGGLLLLFAQYFVLSYLLSQSITTLDGNVVEVSGDPDSLPSGSPFDVSELRRGPGWTHSDPFVSSVLADVQLWSGLFLFAFVAIALVCVWFVSRRVLHRIDEVTEATNEITDRNLSMRLGMDGPADEITRLGSAIDGMIDRLESAFQRQEAFIANASHEFRTPLSSVRTALQVAIRQKRVPEELMPEIEDVLSANRRMEALVSALLIIAQGRAGADLPQADVDLGRLIDDALAETEQTASARGLTVIRQPQAGTASVIGSEPLLRSLVRNLVSNAIVHNVEHGTVWATVSPSSEEVTVTVENTGPKLSPEFAARLTEPFQRGDRSRLRNDDGSEAGTGLGLALVESIAMFHDATLDIAPVEDGGLKVQVSLPRTHRRS